MPFDDRSWKNMQSDIDFIEKALSRVEQLKRQAEDDCRGSVSARSRHGDGGGFPARLDVRVGRSALDERLERIAGEQRALRDENQRLRDVLATKSAAENSVRATSDGKTEEQMRALKGENIRLRALLEKAGHDLDERTGENLRLRSGEQELAGENRVLKERMAAAEETVRDLMKKLDREKKHSDDLAEKIDVLHRERQAREAALNAEQAKNGSTLAREIEKLKAEKGEVDGLLNESESENRQLKDEVARGRELLGALRSEADELRRELDEKTGNAMSAEMARLRDRNLELSKSLEMLKKELKMIDVDRLNAENCRLKAEHAALVGAMKERDGECDGLRRKITVLANDLEAAGEELAQTRMFQHEWELRLKEKDEALACLENQLRDIRALIDENNLLRKEKDKFDRLSGEMANRVRDYEQKIGQLNELSAANERLTSSVARLKEMNRTLDARLKSVKDGYAPTRAEHDNAALQNELAAARRALAQTKKTRARYAAALKEAESRFNSARENNLALLDEVEGLTKSIAEGRERYYALVRRCASLANRIVELEGCLDRKSAA